MNDFLTSLEKIKKISLKILILDIVTVVVSIIFAIVISSIAVNSVNYEYYNYNSIIIVSSIFYVFLAAMFITILALSINLAIKSTTAASNEYGKYYDEIQNIKIFSIIAIFIFGTIFSIIIFVMSKNLISKVRKEHANGTYPNVNLNINNNQSNHSDKKPNSVEKNDENVNKIKELWNLKENGAISNEEFEKLKNDLLKK